MNTEEYGVKEERRVPFMDEEDIKQKLEEINSIHSTFDEKNPITFVIFLTECRAELSQEQIKWCETEIERLKKLQKKMQSKWIRAIDNEISRLPLEQKIGENSVRLFEPL
jgi:chemotaxis regulatin CheY-phosphate phosphatase CheZ